MDIYIREKQETLEEELAALQGKKAAIDQQLAVVSKKLDLIREFVRLEVGGADVQVQVTPASGADVRGLTRKIIQDAGKPLHISEIHRQFLERGYTIPGEGTPFNILAHIVRDKTLARVAKGTYALAADTPQSARMPIAAVKKVHRRRRKRRV
jgi:hypothetical protein